MKNVNNVVNRRDWIRWGDVTICANDLVAYQSASPTTTVLYMSGGHRVYIEATPADVEKGLQDLNAQAESWMGRVHG